MIHFMMEFLLNLFFSPFSLMLTSVDLLPQSLKLLSVMAAIRLDDEADDIDKALSLALVDTRSAASTNKDGTLLDPLASSTWNGVSVVGLLCLIMLDFAYLIAEYMSFLVVLAFKLSCNVYLMTSVVQHFNNKNP